MMDGRRGLHRVMPRWRRYLDVGRICGWREDVQLSASSRAEGPYGGDCIVLEGSCARPYGEGQRS